MKMSIKKAEDKLWHEIFLDSADYDNSKNIRKAIDELKMECKQVYSQLHSKMKREESE
jgi:hypothetical protein